MRFLGTNNVISGTTLHFADTFQDLGDMVVFGSGGSLFFTLTEGDTTLTIASDATLSGRLTDIVRETSGAGVTTLRNQGTIDLNTASATSPSRQTQIDVDVVQNEGTLRLRNGVNAAFHTRNPNARFTNTGTFEIAEGAQASLFAGMTQTGGRTRVNGQLTIASGEVLTLEGGVLDGIGTITGDVVVNGGQVNSGNSPGTLTLIGNYTQTAGTLIIEIGSSGFDVLNITGIATLGGNLEIRFLNDYVFTPGQQFDFLQAGFVMGDFDSIRFFNTSGTASARLENGIYSVFLTASAVAAPEPTTLILLVFGGFAFRRRLRL